MLQKICSTRRVIPATFDVSGALLPPEEVGPREFSDRYKGSLSAEVCIKNLRIYSHGNQDATKEVPHLWSPIRSPPLTNFEVVLQGSCHVETLEASKYYNLEGYHV